MTQPTTSVTILGFTGTPDEWTAWSAVGTVGAAMIALIALLLPLISAIRRRRAAQKELLSRYGEIISAVTNALVFLPRAHDAWRTATHSAGMRSVSGVAAYKGRTLAILAQQPGMTDGAIDSAIGAAEMLACIERAEVKMHAGSAFAGKPDFITAFSIARSICQRIEKVADDRNLPIWESKEKPDLSWPDGDPDEEELFAPDHAITS